MGRFRLDCATSFRRARSWFVLLSWGMIAVGCQPSNPLAGAGLEINPPPTWKPVDPKTRMVPGNPIAAWSGPQGSSLVIYRTLPIPGGTPESIAASLANRLTNLPGLEIKTQRVETVGGHPIARVEIVGPGTGDSLAPSSIGTPMPPQGKALVPTRELILGFGTLDATLYLSWGIPEASQAQLLPEIEKTISALRLPPSGRRSAQTNY